MLNTGLSPLRSVITEPVHLAQTWRDLFEDQTDLLKENHRLKQQKMLFEVQLRQYQDLESELAALKSLNGLRSRDPSRQIIAQVTQHIDQPFSENILINKGSEDDVEIGSPVVDEFGLLGQVYEVHPLSATVRLISHAELLVPVMSERSKARSMLGRSIDSGGLGLRFVPNHFDIQNDDLLVTSGIGYVFPPGIPVARITSIKKGNGSDFSEVAVRPIAELYSSRFVLVLSPRTQS